MKVRLLSCDRDESDGGRATSCPLDGQHFLIGRRTWLQCRRLLFGAARAVGSGSPSPAVRHTFGPFILDLDRHQLLHDGREVHLSLKAYDLLRLLIEACPRVVPKADLHAKLWPDTFVSDATLASVVAEIREALGESARETRFIRTVHGYGYAFAADAVPDAARPRLPALACWLNWGDQRCDLREGETVLGRDHQATICVDALSVSRRHARIVLDGAVATLEDLGSRNGTFVGTRRIAEPVTLSDGDVIRLGSVNFTFRSLIAPRSTVSS